LRLAGADYLVPGARHLPSLVFNEIQPRLMRGAMPGELASATPPDQADREWGINRAPGSVRAPAAAPRTAAKAKSAIAGG
jgi:hypothetical protein